MKDASENPDDALNIINAKLHAKNNSKFNKNYKAATTVKMRMYSL